MSTFRNDLFAGSSAITSSVYFVGDAVGLTADIDIDSETTCVIQGSNTTGFSGPAIAEDDWSTLTTIVSLAANEIISIDPGFRWIRGLRETESSASWARFTIAGRNVAGGG